MALMPNTDIRTPIPHNDGDWVAKFGETWKKQAEAVQAKFGADVVSIALPPAAATDMPTITVKKERVVEILTFLRDDCAYNFLSDLTATDETPREPRFDVVYHLFSHTNLCRIRVKAATDEEVPTVIPVWLGADWAEREVFDMFGLKFKGHPDLRRVLMDERWEGHPLRKDYPLRGYQIFPDAEKIRPELLNMLDPGQKGGR